MTWTLDKAHSEISFSVRHMMVSTVRGRFTDFDATIELDAEQPERSTVAAVIEVGSLTTGNEERDAHLRSADFFDAERHPQIRFESGRVERRGKGELRVLGDLTIRGVTREVELEGEFHGPVQHYAGGRAAGFSLTGEVDREAFGLTWNVAMETGGVLVGRKVKIAIDAEVLERVEEPAAERAGAAV